MTSTFDDLPKNWSLAKINDVADIESNLVDPKDFQSYPHVAPNRIESGNGKLLEYKTIETDAVTSSKHLFFPGHIIYSKIRPYLAKAVIVDFEGLCSADMYPIKANINPVYLHKWLISAEFTHLVSRTQGRTVLPKVNQKALKKIAIPIPPLNEQHRIVTKIEALTTRSRKAREALDAIPTLLDQFRQSVLAAAFRGDLTADWRAQNPDVEPAEKLLERIRVERRSRWETTELEKMKAKGKILKNDQWKKKYKQPSSCRQENVSTLPNTWSWCTADEVSSIGTGATPKKSESKYYEGGTIPWITSGALNSLFVSKASDFITDAAIQETNAKLFPPKTLLVAMYGEGQTRGRVSELLIEAATNQACAALSFHETSEKIQPVVKLFFQKNYEDIRLIASGGVQPNLNLSIIRNTAIPVPPLMEQSKILEKVDYYMKVADAVEKRYSEIITEQKNLDQSILAKAFRGQLVPQDPTDEPASVLLQRIQAEREKLNAKTKKKKTRTKKKK
ncbi:MAG: restriction endonuclease subunit S [Cyanobacteria bacterium J06581_3]